MAFNGKQSHHLTFLNGVGQGLEAKETEHHGHLITLTLLTLLIVNLPFSS